MPGRVLTAEPAQADLDLGTLSDGLDAVGVLVRQVGDALRRSGRPAAADELAEAVIDPMAALAEGIGRLSRGKSEERNGDRHSSDMISRNSHVTGEFSKPVSNVDQNARNAAFWAKQSPMRNSGDGAIDSNMRKLRERSARR